MNTIQYKYCPTKLNQILGNLKIIEYIKDWLKTYEDVKESLKKNGLLKKSNEHGKKTSSLIYGWYKKTFWTRKKYD